MALGVLSSQYPHFLLPSSCEYTTQEDGATFTFASSASQLQAKQETRLYPSKISKYKLLVKAIQKLAVLQAGFPFCARQKFNKHVTQFFNNEGVKLTPQFIKKNLKGALMKAGASTVVIKSSKVECYLPFLLDAVNEYRNENETSFTAKELEQRVDGVFSQLQIDYPDQIAYPDQKKAFYKARQIAIDSAYRSPILSCIQGTLQVQDCRQYEHCSSPQIDQKISSLEQTDLEFMEWHYEIPRVEELFEMVNLAFLDRPNEFPAIP